MKTKTILLIFLIILSVLITIIVLSNRSNTRKKLQSIKQGNLLIEKIVKYHKEYNKYPSDLSELKPKFINTIPKPVYGLGKWNYINNNHFFTLGFIEFPTSCEGDCFILTYNSETGKWNYEI